MKVAPTSFSFILRCEGDIMRTAIDMIGVQEKGWIVLEKGQPTGKNVSKSTYWKCKCLICGAIKHFNGADIRRHKIGECKHKQPKPLKIVGTNIKDETDKKYFNLKVESYAYSQDGFAYWNCRCDCGKDTIVRGDHLRSGSIKSCGCLVSYKEQCISSILLDQNIEYKQQYMFTDLKDIKPLRFDFALFKDHQLIGLIEYNGQQHYEQPNAFNHYGNLQIHDKMKIEYCQKNNIPLLILDKNSDLREIVIWYNNLC